MRWKFTGGLLLILFPLLASAQQQTSDATMDSMMVLAAQADSLREANVVAADTTQAYDEDSDYEDVQAEQHYLWDRAVPVDADTVDGYTPASLTLRRVPATILEGLKADKDLNYHKKPRTLPGMGWAKGIVAAIIWLISTFYVVIIIAVLVLLGTLIFLYLKRNGYIFSNGKSKTVSGDESKETDALEVNDYDKQIQAAISERKYRLAVRLLYLQTLRILADGQRIIYRPDKTNAAYLRELSPTPFYKPFARLTLDYEYIWYGELPVDDAQFNSIHRQFGQFMNELGYTR